MTTFSTTFPSLLTTNGLRAGILMLAVYGGLTAGSGVALAQTQDAAAEVTFQDVLKNPDDPEINFRYAQTQIKKGRLDRAVAALERVLLVQPRLSNVRLLYAIVLFRLDNLNESKAALLALKRETLPADQAAEVDRFLDAIEQRQRRVHHTLNVAFGLHVDTNRNAAPTSGTLSVLDTLIDASSDEKRDFGMIGSVGVETRYDPGSQDGHQLYARANAFTDQQAQLDNQDLLVVGLTAGGILVTDVGTLDLSLSHSRVSLAHSAYVNTNGLKARLDHRLDNDTNLFVEQTMDRQVYFNIGQSTSIAHKTGDTFTTKFGLNRKITPRDTFNSSLSYQKKNANRAYETYRAFNVDLGYTHIFEGGTFATAQGIYDTVQYRAPDTFVSNKNRKDRRFRYRLSTGAPLKALAQTLGGDDASWLPDVLAPVVLLGTVERYESKSNLVNFSNQNWRGQIMLSRTFQF